MWWTSPLILQSTMPTQLVDTVLFQMWSYRQKHRLAEKLYDFVQLIERIEESAYTKCFISVWHRWRRTVFDSIMTTYKIYCILKSENSEQLFLNPPPIKNFRNPQVLDFKLERLPVAHHLESYYNNILKVHSIHLLLVLSWSASQICIFARQTVHHKNILYIKRIS